jgi:sortase (surface protein transpeptidase)
VEVRNYLALARKWWWLLLGAFLGVAIAYSPGPFKSAIFQSRPALVTTGGSSQHPIPAETRPATDHRPVGVHAQTLRPEPVLTITGESPVLDIPRAAPSPAAMVTRQTTLNQDLTHPLTLEDVTPTPPEVKAVTVTAPSFPSSTPVPAAVSQTVALPPDRAPLPVWLTIPSIEVNAPIAPVGLEPSGIMATPREADIVGWYELGPRPGEPSNAILAGHVDWMGRIGSFARLHELRPGDLIEVQSGSEAGYRYVVESLETFQADAAPLADIFGPTEGPVLTLITCGGPYDSVRQVYRDRLIVRARGQ